MFFKEFEFPKFQEKQVLVMLDESEKDQSPAVRIIFVPDGYGSCSFTLDGFENNAEGQKAARNILENVTQEQIETAIKNVCEKLEINCP